MQPVDALIPDLRRRSDNPPADARAQSAVKSALSHLFGQSAQFLAPCLLSSGKLIIYAEAPVWSTHIRHRRQSLLTSLGNLGIEVSDVVVKVQPSVSARQAETPTVPKMSERSLKQIAVTSENIQHPELKQALQRLQKRLAERSTH